ncbi:hypothetical protein J3L16_03995 [Alteromonas sp. 5E99-2]|uniref:golvesin C-terminal-like domain-containing protein n=1 Tax=Alteromonas sp. 5E99-2 TaxID=2817683 RepID=UPI001A986469|nr:hypothetical protein [Alteromonas sp. 5E99-2]MBO1254850.1 hypothetical protein [Alteromonas sp. 5E99-2]
MKLISTATLIASLLHISNTSAEINVIDNDDSGFSVISNWTTSENLNGFWGNNYVYLDARTNTGSAQWEFSLSGSGSYEVSAYWTSNVNRSSDAIYSVHDDNGVTDIPVSQSQNGSIWFPLGEFSNPTKVVLSTNGTDGFVIADAVKAESVQVEASSSLQSYKVVAYGQSTRNIGSPTTTCRINSTLTDSNDESYMYSYKFKSSSSSSSCRCRSSILINVTSYDISNSRTEKLQCIVAD